MQEGDEGSITRWIAGVKAGDFAAAQPLWERYFARMVDLARARLRAKSACCRDAASDEEVTAFSAFDRLGDDVLHKFAILRKEGFTTDAIAVQLGCARRTVARQLALIRRILAAEST